MDTKCSAANKDGSPCNARPWREGLCRWHHPDSQATIAAGRRKGGQAKSNKARARKAIPDGLSNDELGRWLSLAFRKVLTGGMEPGVATAAATVAKAILTVNEAGVLERFEERLSQLERTTRRGWPA